MSYIGSNKIGQMYLGSTEIAKAYLGSTLVFQKGGVTPPSPLPYDSKVEYLGSDGNAYIDTGMKYTVNNCAKFVIDMVIPSNSLTGNAAIYGFSTTAGNWFGQAGGKYGSGSGANSNISIGQRILVVMDYTTSGQLKLYIDGNLVGSRTGTIPTTVPFKLFKVGTAIVTTWVYSFKALAADDTVLQHLIPVRIGQVGYMYDNISESFFSNAGTSDFTFGNDIN